MHDGRQKQFSHKSLSSRYKIPWSSEIVSFASSLLSDCWLDRLCPFFFFHWQNIPFCRALVLPLIPLLHENYMRELCWCCSREMWSLPVCREGSAETKGVCTENYIGQALVWWLYFEGHLQGFPHGPFKEGFLLQWRAKTFYQLSARSIMSCSMAPHPI